MSNLYLPVYPTEDLFDLDKYAERVGAVVCFRGQKDVIQTGAQIRFHMGMGSVICRYIGMGKDPYYDKLAAFVCQEIWCANGAAEINGTIVWKPLTKAEAETLNAVGVPIYYTDDSF